METLTPYILAEPEVEGSIPCLAATISEIGYLLLPSRNMIEISLKTSKQPISFLDFLPCFVYSLKLIRRFLGNLNNKKNT